MDFSEMENGDFAGLSLLQLNYGLLGVKKEQGQNRLVRVDWEDGNAVELASVRLEQDKVYLKAECDFRERNDTAKFYYSIDGENWKQYGEELKMKYTLPHFMGYRFGLFNFATETIGGFVDFDWFRISDRVN